MDSLDVLRNRLSQENLLDETLKSALDEIQAELILADKIKASLNTRGTWMVYKHTAPDGKVYIGITSQSLQNRYLKNGTGYRNNKDLDDAIRMQGWENFKHEIMDANLTREEALEVEDTLIDQYNALSAQHGFNGRRNRRFKEKNSPNSSGNDTSIISSSERKFNTPKNEFEISKELIERFSIKTWKKHFFYLRDGKYVLDEDNNFLARELLETYGLNTKKHREIFKQIAILSRAEPNNELLNLLGETPAPIVEEVDSVTLFYRDCIEPAPPVQLYNGPLYSSYLSWCSQHDLSPITAINWFHRRFKKVSAKTYKSFRSDSTRGYNLKSI